MTAFTKSRIVRILVLCFLLGAQTGALAHEASHVDSSDSGISCEVCAVGHGLDGAVSSDPSCVALPVPVAAPATTESCPYGSNASFHFASRAPPFDYEI